MGRTCVSLMAACLMVLAGPAGLRGEPATEKAIRKEISLLNLLNGLYLSERQLQQLTALSREADGLRATFDRAGRAEASERLAAFRNLREELVNGADVPAAVKREAQLRNKTLKPEKERYLAAMADIAGRAEALFSEGQKRVIGDFKPCLTPPKSLKNPERTGQASASEGFEKALEKVRKAPERRREKARERALERHLEKTHFLRRGIAMEGIEEERQRLGALVDRAMALSDADFEIRKAALAAEAGTALEKKSKPLRRKIVRTFFFKTSTGVLQDKLRAMRADRGTKTSRLSGF